MESTSEYDKAWSRVMGVREMKGGDDHEGIGKLYSKWAGDYEQV